MSKTIVLPFCCEQMDNEKLKNLIVDLEISYDLEKSNSSDYINIENVIFKDSVVNYIQRNGLNERQVKNQIYKHFICLDELEEFIYNNLSGEDEEFKKVLSSKIN